jgi:hypothetical protein
VVGINRNNDFQACLAGLAVSSQNDRGRQKTKGQKKILLHSILPLPPKFKRPTKKKVWWIFVLIVSGVREKWHPRVF